MKSRVKFLESIAGLADPDIKTLDAKYAKIAADLRNRRPKPASEHQIELQIAEMKIADRYAEKPVGFKRDWSFKPGDEANVEAGLAQKWEDAGLVTVLPAAKAAA